MSTLKQQGTKAFIWDFAGKISTHGITFIISIFLARLLEPADFGLIAMAMVFVGIAGIFSEIGLGGALVQRRKVLPIHYASVFYFNMVVSFVLMALLYFSAPFIANFYENNALIPMVQILSITFVINAFSSVQRTKLRKELNYALLTKLTFSSSLLSGIVGISLAFAGFGVWSLIVQSLFSGILFNLFVWTKSQWKPTASFSWKALKQLWGYGFRMFLSGFLETLFTKLDTLIIGKLFEASALGFFNRAKSLDRLIVRYSSGSLMSVLFPVLTKVQHNLPRFKNIVVKSLGIIVFITFLFMGGLYLVSYELIMMLYGDKWLPTVELFKILVFSGFGYPVSALLVNILSSRGNSKAFLRLEIYKKIIGVINLAVAFTWGIEGYLYGLFIVTVLAVYLNIVFASKEIFISKLELIKPIVIQIHLTIITVLIVLFLVQDLSWGLFGMFLVKGVLFSIIYITLNKLFQIDSFTYFLDEFRPVVGKLRNKMGRG